MVVEVVGILVSKTRALCLLQLTLLQTTWCLEMQPTHSSQPVQHPVFLLPSNLLPTQVVLDFVLPADDRPLLRLLQRGWSFTAWTIKVNIVFNTAVAT